MTNEISEEFFLETSGKVFPKKETQEEKVPTLSGCHDVFMPW
jgi:hypothetical protein